MTYRDYDDDKLLPLTGLYFQILTTLAASDNHGYAIGQICGNESNGRIQPAPGALYAALRRLERMGYIGLVEETPGSGSQNKRKVYGITETGKMILSWEADRLLLVSNLAHKRLKG